MRQSVVIVIEAVIMLLLQIAIAPGLSIGHATPNLLLVYALASALVIPRPASLVLSFLLGLAFDLLGGGPLGTMALVLLVMCAFVSWAYVRFDNDSLFIPLVLLVFGVLFSELFYGILIVLCGYPATIGEALLYRSLPCALYNIALALAVFFLLRFFLRVFGTPRAPRQGKNTLHFSRKGRKRSSQNADITIVR